MQNIKCLYNKNHDSRYIHIGKIEETENFKFTELFCTQCNRKWKDFEGVDDANSPVLSIQRQKSLPKGGQDNE